MASAPAISWWSGLTAAVLVIGLAPVAFAQTSKHPAFGEFRVNEAFSGKPAAPILKTPGERRFRTMIRQVAAKGPNFAGHYTIANWGCGAGCVSIAVADAKDGRVYPGPFQVLSWAMFKYEGQYPSNTPEFVPLDFHIDSRLLIARGCPEETKCASYFYEWADGKFKLIRKVDAEPIPQ